MTEVCEKVAFALASSDDNGCPFCPGEETKHDFKSYSGDDNCSKVLKHNMLKPSHARELEKESNTRKKDSYPEPIQSPLENSEYAKRSSVKGKLAFEHEIHGKYRYEAHHCISGNEILKPLPLHKIITNAEDEFKGQIGYTVNNAYNGVYLPSYPKKYYGTWEAMDGDDKYKIMALAMAAGEGQAHIGCHTGHKNDGGKDYPTMIKEELAAIEERILLKVDECPFCIEDGAHKKPFIPPYKVNQWLDNLSKRISRKLIGKADTWPYFISDYARQYYINNTEETVQDSY